MSSATAIAISMVMMVATVMRLRGFKTWLCGGQRSDQNPVRLEDSSTNRIPSLPLPLDEGEKAGCSSSLGIDCQAVPPRWRPLGTIARRCARVDDGKWALGQTAFDSEVRQIAERCGGVPKILVPVTHNLEG